MTVMPEYCEEGENETAQQINPRRRHHVMRYRRAHDLQVPGLGVDATFVGTGFGSTDASSPREADDSVPRETEISYATCPGCYRP